MNEQQLEKALSEMREYIRDSVAAGRKEEEIQDGVVDYLADDYDPDELRPHADLLVREAMEAHFQEQLTWPEKTDCDRLDDAFADLEGAGIVARQDFSCCGTCGSAEIWDEMETVSRGGVRVRGYTFYHMQDTEAAVGGDGVCLNYGAVEEGESAALDIAQEIAKTMQRHGLAVHWDGTWKKRIRVPLDWKRRRQRF